MSHGVTTPARSLQDYKILFTASWVNIISQIPVQQRRCPVAMHPGALYPEAYRAFNTRENELVRKRSEELHMNTLSHLHRIRTHEQSVIESSPLTHFKR